MKHTTSQSFSRAFQQMCAIVAIGETRNRGEVLQTLISHCLLELVAESTSSRSHL